MRASETALFYVMALTVLVGCAGEDADEATPTSPPTTVAHPTSLYDLVTGDCFSGLGRNQDLRVRIVSCARRHQAEVYGAVDLSARRSFPGAEVLRRQAATQCAQRFADYTGEPAGLGTEVSFAEIVPTLDSWSAGDRSALCVAIGLDGAPLRSSIAADAGGST
ncbi:MAG TPA: septum formation family protein [Acidimicrobiales bacterium]